MVKLTIFVVVLYAAISVSAQATSKDRTNGVNQRHSKKGEAEITVRGCVGTQSLDYILIQPDKGNTYELQESQKLRLGPYLGQEVEVTGVESPSMSTSSDFLTRTGSPSPVTITVHSIKSLAKRCLSY